MPQLIVTASQKCGFIWWDSFIVMTSTVNLSARPISQLPYCIVSYCVQSINHSTEKIQKNGPSSNFMFKVISWKLFLSFGNDVGKQYGNEICNQGNFA